MMGQAIEARAGQAFRTKHACPLIERQIAGDHRAAALASVVSPALAEAAGIWKTQPCFPQSDNTLLANGGPMHFRLRRFKASPRT